MEAALIRPPMSQVGQRAPPSRRPTISKQRRFNFSHPSKRLQHEQLLKEDAQVEHRRLRAEAQSYEQNLSRLRKEIEVKERDIATLKIRGRQEVDRHAEELAVMIRDRDALQKHCNNLTRRQIQFQHEIRRKELQYEWLQEKLRNYLAERKRESSASMEIVGLLRQQAPTQQKDSGRIFANIDDLMPGRRSNAKRASNRGPKLDETMVKMIVTAYEEKQKELMAENEDLQEALNSIRKEYTDLMNAQLKAETSVRSLSRIDSKIYTTKHNSLEFRESSEEQQQPEEQEQIESSHDEASTVIVCPSSSSRSSQSTSTPTAQPSSSASSELPKKSSAVHEIEQEQQEDYEGPPEEDVRRMAILPDPVLNADHPDLVPWPMHRKAYLKQTGLGDNDAVEGSSSAENALDSADNTAALLPTVEEERDEVPDSQTSTPKKADVVHDHHDETTLDATGLAEQSKLVVSSLSVSLNEEEEMAGAAAPEPLTKVLDHTDIEVVLTSNSDISKEGGSPKEAAPVKTSKRTYSHPQVTFSGTTSPPMTRSKSQKFVWPPPSPSPQPREERSPTPMRPALGKLPQPSNKPIPNAALLSEEQLKTELRTRAVDVEEAVRALKTACTSMQPQHMKSVMEKRLHVELTMAANLAEQQEAVVNLALAGLEKAKRALPGLDVDLEDMKSTVKTSVDKSEAIVVRLMEMMTSEANDDETSPLQGLGEIIEELRNLREKVAGRRSSISSTTAAPKDVFQDDAVDRDLHTMTSWRERAHDLTKKKEQISRARGDYSVPEDAAPSRRTWAEKAEEDKELRAAQTLSPDSYSDDDDAPKETLSRILHSAAD